MSVKYDIVEHDKAFHEFHCCLKIQEGKYAGVIYQYDVVKFEEKEQDGEDVGYLNFNTIMIENPHGESILEEEDFKNTVGDILVEIIKSYVEEQHDKNRIDDTEEPSK
jgi:hypothetical protein